MFIGFCNDVNWFLIYRYFLNRRNDKIIINLHIQNRGVGVRIPILMSYLTILALSYVELELMRQIDIL